MSTVNTIKLKDLPPAEQFVLSPPQREAIEHEMQHYDDPKAAVIEALKIVQEGHGWVPDGAIIAIGEILGVSPAEVDGVATFYNLIFRQPVGRHVIKICDSVACFLTGYDSVNEAIKNRLGILPGQTTPDNRFTLLPICCLGACDRGPVLMIDDDTHFNLSMDSIDEVLEKYK